MNWSGLRAVLIAALVGLLVALPAGAFPAATGSEAPSSYAAAPGWLKSARAQLPKLKIRRAASMAGYSRAQFGPAWKDVDANGCDTRNDILARDLKNEVLRAGSTCIVERGTLRDPYTGKTIVFVRGPGTSSSVQIDHVVALAAAWRTGAKEWAADRRLRYANDPLVLLAVDGPTNASKGDRDASQWLPPRIAYHCRYIARQVSIKTKYKLWLTRTERTKMVELLSGC